MKLLRAVDDWLDRHEGCLVRLAMVGVLLGAVWVAGRSVV